MAKQSKLIEISTLDKLLYSTALHLLVDLNLAEKSYIWSDDVIDQLHTTICNISALVDKIEDKVKMAESNDEQIDHQSERDDDDLEEPNNLVTITK